MSKKEKKFSILRVQVSVAVCYNDDEDIKDIIENTEFDASHKDVTFVAIRPLNYQVVNHKRK